MQPINISPADLKNPQQALKEAAIAYRSGMLPENGVNDTAFGQLKAFAYEWKKKASFNQQCALNQADLADIAEAAGHSRFAVLLLIDRQIRTRFFEWTLRDHANPRFFIRYPEECGALKSKKLQAKIGFLKSAPLQEADQKLQIKIGDTVFSSPDEVPTLPIEPFQDSGLLFWNGLEAAKIDPETKGMQKIDSLQSEWWKKLPRFEVAEKMEYRVRMNLSVYIPENAWIFSIVANRGQRGLDMDTSHTYVEIAVPCNEGYSVYPFGKFSEQEVEGHCARVAYITDTQRARIAYPDPTALVNKRQFGAFSCAIPPESGAKAMEVIGKDIHLGQSGNLVIQYGWDNCANWSVSVAKRSIAATIPPIFSTFILSGQPSTEPMRTLIGRVREAPVYMQHFWIYIFSFLLGWRRGVQVINEEGKQVFRSVATSPFSEHYHTNIPARLPELIEQGRICGALWMGFERGRLSLPVPAAKL